MILASGVGTSHNKPTEFTNCRVVKVTRADDYCKRDFYLRIQIPGDDKTKTFHCNFDEVKFFIDGREVEFDRVGYGRRNDHSDIRGTDSPAAATRDFHDESVIPDHDETVLTDDMLRELIQDRFEVMNLLADSIVSQDVRSLIISGAPGIGKTHTLEKKLENALSTGRIEKLSHMKGKITPLSLYVRLYEHCESGQVLLLDDIDVFSDQDSLNLLKAALDTGKRRISWATTHKWLEENDIPQEFDFEGAVVFITNKNFDREMKRTTNITEHYKALISRSSYLDLMVHTNREIMLRVEQIIYEGEILIETGITVEQGQQALNFLRNNISKLRELSIRSVHKIAANMRAHPNDWERISRVMMLNRF